MQQEESYVAPPSYLNLLRRRMALALISSLQVHGAIDGRTAIGMPFYTDVNKSINGTNTQQQSKCEKEIEQNKMLNNCKVMKNDKYEYNLHKHEPCFHKELWVS